MIARECGGDVIDMQGREACKGCKTWQTNNGRKRSNAAKPRSASARKIRENLRKWHGPLFNFEMQYKYSFCYERADAGETSCNFGAQPSRNGSAHLYRLLFS